MLDSDCLAGPAVVVLPDEIDVSNADSAGERLVAAVVPGVAVVIADLTGTVFCDCAGVNGLLLACRKARAGGAELRLVVNSRAVLRVLELLGADQVLPVYPDLGAALAADRRRGRPLRSFPSESYPDPRWHCRILLTLRVLGGHRMVYVTDRACPAPGPDAGDPARDGLDLLLQATARGEQGTFNMVYGQLSAPVYRVRGAAALRGPGGSG